jgi:hypothetical protein
VEGDLQKVIGRPRSLKRPRLWLPAPHGHADVVRIGGSLVGFAKAKQALRFLELAFDAEPYEVERIGCVAAV